jgi:hypothetical protein
MAKKGAENLLFFQRCFRIFLPVCTENSKNFKISVPIDAVITINTKNKTNSKITISSQEK